MPPLSADLIAEAMRQLREHGELSPAMRWDLFPTERQECELVYAGKTREEDVIAGTMAVPLQPIRSFNNGGGQPEPGKWYNQLIFGDNLQALKSLAGEPDVAGKVRLVYIDPPFATKREFQGNNAQRAYQDKVRGAEFVEFIRRRLIMIRELMAPDASIYVHLDWRKAHYIRAVLDEVFGEGRFQAEVVWQRSDPHNDAVTRYGRVHDLIYWYSRGPKPVYHYREITDELSEAAVAEYNLARLPDGRIVPWDESLAGEAERVKLENFTVKGQNPRRKFAWRGAKPSAKRQWPVDTPEEMDALLADGVLHLRKPAKGAARCLVVPLKRREDEGQLVQDIWLNCGRMKGGSSYPTQKPERLLERIIRASSDPGDLVLDAFAGSGTTLAVAEKLGRRWVGIDCGRLSMYTIQSRLLRLHRGVDETGEPLPAKPFVLRHAGLYDFAALKDLPWRDWRFFALQLFECKDAPEIINGLAVDGTRKGAPVLVYDWRARPGERISEATIDDIHQAVASRIGNEFFLIAPMRAFDFLQDYVERDGVRYWALKIPYSMIADLHARDFQQLTQARAEAAVNEIAEAHGFSFMLPPDVAWEAGCETDAAGHEWATLRTTKFSTRTGRAQGEPREGLSALSMLMLDTRYDGQTFALTDVCYGEQLEAAGWTARVRGASVGETVMAVWIDEHGNETKHIIPRVAFGLGPLAPPAPGVRAKSTSASTGPSTGSATPRRGVAAVTTAAARPAAARARGPVGSRGGRKASAPHASARPVFARPASARRAPTPGDRGRGGRRPEGA